MPHSRVAGKGATDGGLGAVDTPTLAHIRLWQQEQVVSRFWVAVVDDQALVIFVEHLVLPSRK